MPLVILHHLLNVSVQLADKRGYKKSIMKLEAVKSLESSEDVCRTTWPYIQTVALFKNALLKCEQASIKRDKGNVSSQKLFEANKCKETVTRIGVVG
jgi:hypothetical protein